MSIKKSFAIYLSVVVTLCVGNRIIVTDVGSFEGEQASDGDFFQFLGIPYGKVDDDNPFGISSPYPPIEDTFIANDDSVICPQRQNNGIYEGSLDCLHLSVYVPTTATNTSQLPVMAYIHGGFFMNGESRKDVINPRFLVRHDVIFVAIRYRVGPYGFMCLNRRAVPGNQGLKDQALGLKWIRDHIQAFGGNPNQVTLFGQSAGGHSVDFHLLSEQEKLYNNIIIQSGSSLATTVLYPPDREVPIKLASHLGLPSENISEALSSLANADPIDVVRATAELSIQFKPCAETKFDDVEPFLTEYWINSPVPKAEGVPIMIGFTEYEFILQHINGSPGHFENQFNIFYNYLNQRLDFDDERRSKMEDYVKRFYLGDDAISQQMVWQLINFESDYVYNHPIQRSIKKFVSAGAANIFYYMFSYSGSRNLGIAFNAQGAGHSDDLRYIFDNISLPPIMTVPDQIIIDRMTTMWTNFAKYSDPTPEITTLLPVRWTPLTNETYHYLNINLDLNMERRPFNRRMAFWDLFFKLNDEYQIIVDALPQAEDDENSGTVLSSSLLHIFFTSLLMIVLRN